MYKTLVCILEVQVVRTSFLYDDFFIFKKKKPTLGPLYIETEMKDFSPFVEISRQKEVEQWVTMYKICMKKKRR